MGQNFELQFHYIIRILCAVAIVQTDSVRVCQIEEFIVLLKNEKLDSK